jgi:hypothetical protein
MGFLGFPLSFPGAFIVGMPIFLGEANEKWRLEPMVRYT